MDASPLLIKIASLEKIIRSKKTLGRPRDLAVIEILERTLDEKKRKDRSKQLKALKKESERNLIEQIRRQLSLPMNRRTNFLRKRLPGVGSCLLNDGGSACVITSLDFATGGALQLGLNLFDYFEIIA